MYLPAPDESAWVGVLRLGLVVPGARSLKDKRRGFAAVRDRIRARHGFSVAEIGHHEDTLRGVLLVVTGGAEPRVLRSVLDGLAHEVEGWGQVVVESRHVEVRQAFDDAG
ncbi:MAG: hypothetical protein RL199_1812 [Pseudomonadota bacterium]